MKYAILLPTLAIFLLAPAFVDAASSDNDVKVVLFDDQGELVTSFHPFGEDYRGAASIASGDIDNDGVSEIIIGSGPGLAPNVKIFRQDGSFVNEFLAYQETYQNGLMVTVCDLNNDGQQEIVTGTMLGGGPHVRIFDTDGNILYGGGFFAYAEDFRGGVNVACGDVDADGLDDIVTGAGITGGPHVKVFTPFGEMKYEVFAGSALENTGATVAVGDLNNDGDVEIIAGRMGIGDPTIIVFDFKQGRLTFMLALQGFPNYQNGIQVTSGDVDGDGFDEIGVSTNRHELGLVKFYEMTGATAASIIPFNSEMEKGVVATTIKNSQHDYILALSSPARTSDQIGKYIEIDISDQTLYAYENGVLVRSFLVSTGVYRYPTPYGKTEVMAKLLWHDYIWSYGPGHPDNYNLPDVKYNLRFRPHYYIHYAYWHDNFGNRMSHGCVNVDYDNAEWTYFWADVGTPVEVVP